MLLSIYDVSYKQQCLQLCPKGRETTVRHSQRSGQAVPHSTVVMPWGWRVKAGMVRVWVAGKTV